MTNRAFPEVWAYTWDPFDKLTDVKLNGVLVYHFIYDAFGNRVARCTVSNCSAGEREINDGSQFVLARNGNNVVTDAYGYYPGGDQPMSLQLPSGRTGVFITDPQLRGTVRAIADVDSGATNVEFKTYDISPWGEVAADTGSITRLRMAGQRYDQGSELYYMRARYYDPALGRFLSEDPIGISGGLNLYAYAGNDPVNAADPSGMLTCAPHAFRVTVNTGTWDDYKGHHVEADTLWSTAVPVGLDCSGDGDSGGHVPGTTGPSKGGGPGGGSETMGRGPNDHRRRCVAALVKVGAHLLIDATALNEVRSAVNLMHDAAVMRNVSRILDLPEAAAASNRMMGTGVAKVTERFGLGEMIAGAARDLDVDYLIDRAAGVTPTTPRLGRTLWGFLPGASTAIAALDAYEECR